MKYKNLLKRFFIKGSIIILLFLVSNGCVKRDIIGVNVAYELKEPVYKIETIPKIVLALEDIIDNRKNKERIGVMSGAIPIVALNDINGLISIGIQTHLEKSGLNIILLKKGEGFKEAEKKGAKGLIRVSIEVLWIDVIKPKTFIETSSKVKLKISLADVRTGNILWSGNVEGSYKSEDLFLSDEKVNENINNALSIAINDIIGFSEFREKIIGLGKK